MNKQIIIIAALAVGILTAAAFWSTESSVPAENKLDESPVRLISQTSEEGAVAVTVTPSKSDGWSFEILLNTHSVELAEDLAAVSVLVDEKGRERKPLAWEGDPPGGHHRSGVLRFGEITPTPKEITLLIRLAGEAAERKFVWKILP